MPSWWGIYSDCHSEEDGGFTAGVGGEGLSQHKDTVRDAFYYQRLLSRERRPTSGNSMLTIVGSSREVAWGGEEWVES